MTEFLILVFIIVALHFIIKNNGQGFNRGFTLGKDNPNAIPFVVVVDVETTGLILDKSTPTKKKVKDFPDNYPRILQIAWVTLSRQYEVVARKSYYIKQEAPIPERVIDIHGITDEICGAKGRNLVDVLKEFSSDIKQCGYVVGHNVMFDKWVIEAECLKVELEKPFKHKKKYDTMRMAGKIMKRRYFTLEDLSIKMFGRKQLKSKGVVLHNAEEDVNVTATAFAWLHKNNLKY